MIVTKSPKLRFIQYPGKPDDYYLMIDGVDDKLKV